MFCLSLPTPSSESTVLQAFVSSDNLDRNKSASSRTVLMSLLNMTKSRGPRTLPLGMPGRLYTIENYMLLPVCQPGLNPSSHLSSDTKGSAFEEESGVSYFVECLHKVKVDHVHTVIFIHKLGHYLKVFKKISEAGAARNKSMLSSKYEVVEHQMFRNNIPQQRLKDTADD